MSTDMLDDLDDLDDLTEGLEDDRDNVAPDEPGLKERIADTFKGRKRRSDAGKPRGPRAGTRRVTKARVTALAGKLAEGANLIAAGLMSVDPYSATVVGHNAERLGNAWAPVIAHNQRLARMIDNLEKGGNIGAAVLVTASVALPIMVHHRPQWFPPQVQAIGRALGPSPVSASESPAGQVV